jgi:hypothetical protein
VFDHVVTSGTINPGSREDRASRGPTPAPALPGKRGRAPPGPVRLQTAIACVTPWEKLLGRVDAIWAAGRQKLPTRHASRRARTEEKEFARSERAELH